MSGLDGLGDAGFRAVFEHSNDAIFVVDPVRDEILDANPKACAMLGYTRDELLSVPMSVIHPTEMDKVRAFSESVFERGHGWTDELSCLTRGKQVLSAEMSASIVRIDGGTWMIAMVRDVSDRVRLTREKEYLEDQLQTELGFDIVGDSPALRSVLDEVGKVAATDASVLVTGESGTGKELIARAIHERSPRASGAFVRVNCPSIPRDLFESEFFGHSKGAFTGAVQHRAGRFELADDGTIFLDEIAEIPIELQSKLLRVLQEGELERVGESRTRRVSVRVVSATNRDLPEEIKAGRFREDLYYRLNVFPIRTPALRERAEDIEALARHFLASASRRLSIPMPELTAANVAVLRGYHWPGNIRELQNVLERAAILASGGKLSLDLGDAPGRPPTTANATAVTLDDIKQLEREVIVRALDDTDWRVYGDDGAAARLAIKPTTLASRMKKMGIERGQVGH